MGRNLAYSGWSKICSMGEQHEQTAFIWRLNAGSEEVSEAVVIGNALFGFGYYLAHSAVV